MAKRINARRKGDQYQARVFWLKLLQMRTGDYIQSVTLESDQVSFVDDVVVSYRKPIIERVTERQEIVHDFIQCKYHMTQRDAFTYENLIDPRFINCKDSMLKRLYDAYLHLSNELAENTFRLYIFSNWHWDHRDALAAHLHEEMIRPTFYEKGPRSKQGEVRTKLAAHLGISEDAFCPFFNAVRFTLGKDLTDLGKDMEPLIEMAQLQPIDPATIHNIYDNLTWELFGQGHNTFDEKTFNQMVREEKLIAPSSTEHSEISIQSFSQFARRPHDLQADHLDLLQFFDGRYIKSDSYWVKEIPEKISRFMLNEDLLDLPQPIHIFFDCHLSIAFFAGHLISPKHAIQIISAQKIGSNYTLCEQNITDVETELWKFQTSGKIGEELVVGISVTHPVETHLQPYLEAENLTDLPQILVYPIAGTHPKAVSDGDHAWQLGYQLAKRLRDMISNTCYKIHLFFAVPAALAYIFGHTLGHIAKVIQVYEHDFEGQRYQHRYYPSLQVPYQP